MESDAGAPVFVVRNEQRVSVSGTRWPGCRWCGHVYGHHDACAYLPAAAPPARAEDAGR